MDTGDILLQRKVPISDEDDSATLYAALSEIGADVLVETLEGLEGGTLTPCKQDSSRATRAPKLTKTDGEIDWTQSAERIWCLVRGTVPWPVAYTHHGDQVLRVWKVSWRPEEPCAEAGEVLSISDVVVEVSAGRGVVELIEVQPENGRRMSAVEYARGHLLKPGDRLV